MDFDLAGTFKAQSPEIFEAEISDGSVVPDPAQLLRSDFKTPDIYGIEYRSVIQNLPFKTTVHQNNNSIKQSLVPINLLTNIEQWMGLEMPTLCLWTSPLIFQLHRGVYPVQQQLSHFCEVNPKRHDTKMQQRCYSAYG